MNGKNLVYLARPRSLRFKGFSKKYRLYLNYLTFGDTILQTVRCLQNCAVFLSKLVKMLDDEVSMKLLLRLKQIYVLIPFLCVI